MSAGELLARAAAVVDPTAIVSWPAAAVAIVVVLAGVALQAVQLVLTHRVRQDTHHVRQDAAQAAAQTQHNGGSTQRDEISSMRRTLEEHVTQDAEWKTADAEWKADVESRLPPAS